METHTMYRVLRRLTEHGAFSAEQAEKLIGAVDIMRQPLATTSDLDQLRSKLNLRLARMELRLVLQIYAAIGLLFAALQAFGA